MSSLRSKKNKGTTKKESQSPAWVVALKVTFGILAWFLLGSWGLALVIDQMNCTNNQSDCMLPNDEDNIPYRSGPRKHRISGIIGLFLSIFKNMGILMIIKKIFGIESQPVRSKNKKYKPPRKSFNVENFLTKVDVGGFKPFDSFNGPVGWPYSLADDDESTWESGYFTQWFGEMQIESWAIPRGFLSGFLSLFAPLTENIFTRFILTFLMPIIMILILILQPFVSFCTSVYSNFSAGIFPWGIFFFIVPIFTIMTGMLQNFETFWYLLFFGGKIGTGARQLAINLDLDMKKGYGRIMQVILAVGLITSLVLFIVDKKKSAKTADK